MYSREEISRTRHEFWTTFGRYMRPVLSAEGLRINWVNYHTGIKDVYFRMEASHNTATISVSIEHSDPEIQELYFAQFIELKEMLHTTLGESWQWELHARTGDGVVSRVAKSLQGASVMNREQWPELISFFKPRIISLDEFWESAKYSFGSLR